MNSSLCGQWKAPLFQLCGAVCTLYTTLGGLKAVVWTDTIQAVFMYGGLITLIVKAVYEIGEF